MNAVQQLANQGYRPQDVAQQFQRQQVAPAPAAPAQQAPAFDPNAFRNEILASVRAESERTVYRNEVASEEGFIKNSLESLTSGIKNDEFKAIAAAAFENELNKARTVYPENHPLRNEMLRPLSREQVEAVKTAFSEKIGKAKASVLADIGDSRNKAQTASGDATSQGTPANPKAGRAAYEVDADEMTQFLAAQMQAMTGGAVSQTI